MWYKFSAPNAQTQYGWTTVSAIASAACDWLNKDRVYDPYTYEALGDRDDTRADGDGILLSDYSGLLMDDDTRLSDFDDDQE